jgi:hypothetical protein
MLNYAKSSMAKKNQGGPNRNDSESLFGSQKKSARPLIDPEFEQEVYGNYGKCATALDEETPPNNNHTQYV